ncbi:hypothetical protein AAHE18_09G141200 [Arachis hypogaea]
MNITERKIKAKLRPSQFSEKENNKPLWLQRKKTTLISKVVQSLDQTPRLHEHNIEHIYLSIYPPRLINKHLMCILSQTNKQANHQSLGGHSKIHKGEGRRKRKTHECFSELLCDI